MVAINDYIRLLPTTTRPLQRITHQIYFMSVTEGNNRGCSVEEHAISVTSQ